jgi:3-hydroxyisobutyrate dehydrogenase-like beta-hydroxyacid dehydrogenase
MNVGFIGLGHMGVEMAARLVEAGHRVWVYNRTLEKAEALRAPGVTITDCIADACDGDVVFTMLSDDAAVESVTLGEGGILKSLAHGAIHVSSSTISVALADRLAALHGAASQGFVSAPVLGRPEMAAEGKLFVVAGGATAAVRASLPLFEAFGQRTFVVSERPALANLVKLSVNFLTASVI